MSRTKQDFRSLVERIVGGTELDSLRPVVEKEIIHYDIIQAMHKHGYLKDMVFQGGTSLRLIYGSNRFSEDLDFAGGPEFSKKQVDGVAEAIAEHIDQRYGLSVSVKLPKEKPLQDGVNVSAWQISIETAPARRDLPRQRIKLEIANVTAHTRNMKSLNLNYPYLPPSYSGLILPVETLEEIMADKIVSLPAVTTHVRNRDIWDIGFLKQNIPGFKPDASMIQAKVEEYGIEDFEDKISDRIASIPELIEGRDFLNEMSRFLTPSMYEGTLQKPEFREYLSNEVSGVLRVSRDVLFQPGSEPEFKFKM